MTPRDIPLKRRRTLVELRDGDCRWPIGDPREASFFFCGAPAVPKGVYCAGHRRIAYAAVAPQRQNVDL